MKSSSAFKDHPVFIVFASMTALLLFILIAEPCRQQLKGNLGKNPEARSAPHKNYQDQGSEINACSDWEKRVFNMLEVGAAIVMAWFTVSLTRLANSADKTSKKELRAYISVSSSVKTGISLSPAIDLAKVMSGDVNTRSGWYILADFVLINNGSTPAKNVRVRAGFRDMTAMEDVTDILVRSNTPRVLVDIPKGAEQELSISRECDDQTRDRLVYAKRSPGDKRRAATFFGVIDYLDVFDDPHYTEFCFVVDREVENGKLSLFLVRDTEQCNRAT